MTDMGVPPILASSVIAVLAQRLVRKICTRCKHNVTLSEAVLADAGIPPEMAKFGKFAKGKAARTARRRGTEGESGFTS